MSCQMLTQKKAILSYVKKHRFITRYTAATELEVMNLWARISELEEEDGYRFDRRKAKSKRGKKVLQYWLREGRQTKRAA
jgi:predicted patatin/cPLA2 family phospholipase